MPSVTYQGPDDPRDPTEIFVVPVEGSDPVELRKGEAVDVSPDVVKVLQAQEGHQFQGIGSPSPAAPSPSSNPAGTSGAGAE